MSTKYRFKVTPSGAELELTHNLLTIDDWVDTAASDKLVVSSGSVDAHQPGKLICHSGSAEKAPVITLIGASWSSQSGDRGRATCDLCTDTTPDQTWSLVSVV